MLTVSLVGKKFSCSIQLKISTEKEGGGLELALKAGEKCNTCPQSISNVNATLNVTIQNGCGNYVTKCKEMLMFLQEQALPKTMNIMKVHMVNREMKNLNKDDTRLFSCIKQKKRERERGRSASTDRLSSRAKRKRIKPPDGYSSDTEQAIRGHSCAGNTEHRMDILATPRMSRHRLKNAALLRNRRNREASKERQSVPEKEAKQTKKQSIEIQLNESGKKRTSSTASKKETEIEKETLIYEGGSESSLYELSKDSSSGSITIRQRAVKNSEESELSDIKDYKATESDMSADSLECLDIEPEEPRKSRKDKPPKRIETMKQTDRKSRPSNTSTVPALVLPSDPDDSSSDCSDSRTTEPKHKYTKTRKSSSDFTERGTITETSSSLHHVKQTDTSSLHHVKQNSSNTEPEALPPSLPGSRTLSSHDVYQLVKESAHEIVQDVICAAIKKCQRRASCSDLNSVNKSDVRSSTIIDSNEKYMDELENRKRTEWKEGSTSTTRQLSTSKGDIPYYISRNDDNTSNNDYIAATTEPFQGGNVENINKQRTTRVNTQSVTAVNATEHAQFNAEAKTDHVQYNNEEKPTCTPRSTQTSPIKDTLSKDQKQSLEKGSLSLRTSMMQSDTGQNTSARNTEANKSNNINTPVRLYDTHDNITRQIINSMSRVLHLKTKYVTPSHEMIASDVTMSRGHAVTPDSYMHASEQYSLHKELMSHTPFEFQIQLSDSLAQNGVNQNRKASLPESQGGGLGRRRKSTRTINSAEQDSLIEEFCKKLPYNSKGISSKVNTLSDRVPTSGYCFFVIGPDKGQEENKNDKTSSDNTENKEETQIAVESVQKRRKTSLYRRSLSHHSERKKWQTTDYTTKTHHRSLSDGGKSKSIRANKCVSCPVLSEEDIVLESLESHHQDICNSLSQRTWICLRVHEQWKANKHEEALKTCMELTGVKKTDSGEESLWGSSSALDLVGNKDIVLFLNILLQLPIAGSAWTLNMCDLVLPELKLFVSTRIHTSHVDMTCQILHIIVKKVSGAVLKAQTANKEKPAVLKNCVSHLHDVKERVSKVLMARRPKMYATVTTEDPIALKPVLRELLTAIQTLLNVYIV